MQSKTEYPTIELTEECFEKILAKTWAPKCLRCEYLVRVYPNIPRAGMHTGYCSYCGARWLVEVEG